MAKHSPLVMLKNGASDSDAIVVCIPGAGDGISSFVWLCANFSESMTVYGMQARGLDEHETPYDSISEMVEIYSAEILSVFQGKRIYIIGHSFGGFIAVELANKFSDKSIELGTLVLLDVSPPQDSVLKIAEEDMLLELIEVMELSSDYKFNITKPTLKSLDFNGKLKLIHKKMVEAKLLPASSGANTIRGMVNVFLRNGAMEYLPSEIYKDSTILINAAESKQTAEKRRESAEKWSEFIPNLRYAESQGNHITLLNKRNSRDLAKLIEESWAANQY